MNREHVIDKTARVMKTACTFLAIVQFFLYRGVPLLAYFVSSQTDEINCTCVLFYYFASVLLSQAQKVSSTASFVSLP